MVTKHKHATFVVNKIYPYAVVSHEITTRRRHFMNGKNKHYDHGF